MGADLIDLCIPSALATAAVTTPKQKDLQHLNHYLGGKDLSCQDNLNREPQPIEAEFSQTPPLMTMTPTQTAAWRMLPLIQLSNYDSRNKNADLGSNEYNRHPQLPPCRNQELPSQGNKSVFKMPKNINGFWMLILNDRSLSNKPAEFGVSCYQNAWQRNCKNLNPDERNNFKGEFELEEYNLYKIDHPIRQGRGVAIYVQKHLRSTCCSIDTPQVIGEEIESTVRTVPQSNRKHQAFPKRAPHRADP